MTALYAILAIIAIYGIMFGAYCIGFDDGVTAEQMRRSLYIIDKHVTLDEEKHRLTHADLVQMEVEAKAKEQE